MFFIISAQEAELNNLIRDLFDLNLTIQRVEGCYKGIPEISIMVSNNSVYSFDLMRLAKKYKQESILFVDEDGEASLFYTDNNKIIDIGRWQKTDSIDGVDAYSIINNEIFIVK